MRAKPVDSEGLQVQQDQDLARRCRPAAKWLGTGLLALAMAGCQPAAPLQRQDAGLTSQQQMLRSQGFVQSEKGWELKMPGKLLFEFDSADLDAGAQARIVELGRVLSAAGIERLRIEGYTDDRGSDAYNLRLSLRRAQAVAHWLVEAGMARDRLEIRGLGRSQPVEPGHPAENRRVAIVVPAP